MAIKYSAIIKRSNALNSIIRESTSNVDSDRLYSNLESVFTSSKNGKEMKVQIALRSYLESLSNKENANLNSDRVISIIEFFDNKENYEFANRVMLDFNNRILPYVENLSDVSYYIERHNILDSQKKSISDNISIYESCDRIKRNSDLISNRFELDNIVKKYNYLGDKYFTESICNLIDTYNIESYKKVNVAIDEACYLLESNGLKYDISKVSNNIIEYFMLRENNFDINKKINFSKVLKSNYFTENENIDSCVNKEYNNNSINNGIKSFYNLENKDKSSLKSIIRSILSTTSKDDIKNNIGILIDFIFDCEKSNIINKDDIKEIFGIIMSSILDSENEYSKDDLKDISDELKNISLDINKIESEGKDKFKSDRLNDFINNIFNITDDIDEFKNNIYDQDNIDAIEFVNRESVEPISLNEFKIFKFHNLVRAAFNADKILKAKEKTVYLKGTNKMKKFLSKVKNALWEDASLYKNNFINFIGKDYKADICIRQYPYDESDIEDLQDFLSNSCKNINESLNINNNDSIRSYYIINPGIAEIRIKESTPIDPNYISMEEINSSIDPSLDIYIENMNQALKINKYILEIADDIDLLKEEDINEAVDIINSTILEIGAPVKKTKVGPSYSMADDWDEDDEEEDDEEEKEDNEKQSNSSNNTSSKEKDEINNKKTLDTKQAADDSKIARSNDNSKGGININGIRLGIEGLRKKYKDMRTNEKQLSQNMDNSVRSLVKGFKDARSNEARERIIKGTVIPSMSSIMKTAIAMAGSALIDPTHIIAPVLIAVGGFALDKKATEREKRLILDEIETELEVVDKEIQLADSNNDMKKLRALMTYKKNLQRQYQRIRYNIRVGKDILPNSNTGMVHPQD